MFSGPEASVGRARPTPGAAGARVWARSGALTFALKYGLHSSIRIHPFYVKFAHKASGYEAITCRFGDFTPRTGSPALGSLKMQRAPRGEGWASPGRRGPAPSPAAPLPPRPPHPGLLRAPRRTPERDARALPPSSSPPWPCLVSSSTLEQLSPLPTGAPVSQRLKLFLGDVPPECPPEPQASASRDIT